MNQPSEILDRVPPHSLESEKGVIGSLLLDHELCDEVARVIRTEDFYADANQKLYGHIQAIHEQRLRLDSTLLLNRITESGDMEAIGGAAYLAEVLHAVPHAANAIHYAKIVRDKSRLRRIIHAATTMLREAWEASAEPKDVLESAERSLAEIRTNNSDKALVTAQDAAVRAMDRIDAIYRKERTAGLLTGLWQFDKDYGGLFPGELIILAARLKVGKTTLACQWADHIASNGKLVYFASLEMDAAELATKIMCRLGGVSGVKIRNGSISAGDLAVLADVGVQFGQRSIVFDERPRLKIADIRREARRLVRDGLKLVVVDYLQIIRPSDTKETRERQVAAMAEDLKSLAKELHVPVLALAQLNRTAVKEGGGGAEGLRESDVIGQTADMVIRLDVKDGKATRRGEQDKPDEYWLRVVANRNGPDGKFRLSWDRELAVFDSYERTAAYEPAFTEYDGRRDGSEW